MSEMSTEMKKHYLKEADDHANFLAEKVFKPAFVMAFIHGVKHGRKDASGELNQRYELRLNKLKLKDRLNREHKLRERNKKPVEVTVEVINVPKRQTRCKRKKR